MTKKLAYFIIICCLSLCLSSLSFANNFSWAQIEIIVFKRANFYQYIPERLPDIPQDKEAIKIFPTAENIVTNNPPPYQYLDGTQMYLNAVAHEITTHTHNTVLAHIAWRQPIAIDHYGKVVQFFAGRLFNAKGQQISLSDSQVTPTLTDTDTETNTNTDTDADTKPITPTLIQDTTPGSSQPTNTEKNIWEVAGHLQIEKVNNYYNVRTIVAIHQPILATHPVEQPMAQASKASTAEPTTLQTTTSLGIKTVILKQTEHVTPGKISYFDHPALGMLIFIKTYTPRLQS